MSVIRENKNRAFCDKVIQVTVCKTEETCQPILQNPAKSFQNFRSTSAVHPTVALLRKYSMWKTIKQPTNKSSKSSSPKWAQYYCQQFTWNTARAPCWIWQGRNGSCQAGGRNCCDKIFLKNFMQEVKNRFLGHLVFSNHSQRQLLSWPSLLCYCRSCYWSPCRPWGWKADARSATQCNSSKMCIFTLLAWDTFKLP